MSCEGSIDAAFQEFGSDGIVVTRSAINLEQFFEGILLGRESRLVFGCYLETLARNGFDVTTTRLSGGVEVSWIPVFLGFVILSWLLPLLRRKLRDLRRHRVWPLCWVVGR